MHRRNRPLFWAILVITIILIFIANAGQRAQLGIYTGWMLPLGESLRNGHGYALNGEPALYPMWGYPALIALAGMIGDPSLMLRILQFILALAGIISFYRTLGIEPKLRQVPLLLPYIAAESARWPEAIVLPLIMIALGFHYRYLRDGDWKMLLAGSVLFGIILNVRCEYLSVPFFILPLYPLLRRAVRPRRIMTLAAVTFAAGLIALLPWALRSFMLDGKPRFSSSNGGQIAYISLGELRDNPWKITPLDSSGEAFARAHGIPYNYSAAGDSLLQSAFIARVRQHPAAYAHKVLGTFTSALTGGVYVGEYSSLFMSPSRLDSIGMATALLSRSERLRYVRRLPTSECCGMLLEYMLRFLSALLLAALLVMLAAGTALARRSDIIIPALALAYLLQKLVIVSLLHYEARYMNSAYLPLLAAVMLTAPAVRAALARRLGRASKVATPHPCTGE
jgi:hypothetical protein